MTKNEVILKPFEVIERQILEVENVVEKNKDFTILFFSQLYTQLDTCQKIHPHASDYTLDYFKDNIHVIKTILLLIFIYWMCAILLEFYYQVAPMPAVHFVP